MENSKVIQGVEARKAILQGVNVVYNALRATLGPSGKNALLSRTFNRGPRNTNDGYMISECILPKNPHVRLAADFFKEGSKKTNELVGDGTTTTAVLCGHIINKILKQLPDENIPAVGVSKIDVMAIRRQLKDEKDKVIAEIRKRAK